MNLIDESITKSDLKLYKLVSIATNGAKSLIDHKQGLVGRLRDKFVLENNLMK